MRSAVAEMTPSQRPRRRVLRLACVFALAITGPCVLSLVRPGSASAALCDPGVSNPIACENSKPGTPQDVWDAPLDPSPSIEGFATDISVDHGQTIHFKVKTNAQDYRIDIYRLGYYNGMGARQVATVFPTSLLPQIQPGCMTDTSTFLVDCGNWAESASWAVPADAVSGVYLARLVRTDTGEASHIIFIVRDDEGHSNLLFKTSDTTWQAYNSWGGKNLYPAGGQPRAYKVSYNRPFNTRANGNGRSFFFTAEFPMVRFLERNGYDMSYISSVDADRYGSLLLNHRTVLSVGHDEYWSAGERANFQAARNAGVNLAFFSGNEMFWKTRWEPSIDGSNTPYRTLVCYKETLDSAKIDPTPTWTGTWRDPRFSPPSDGGQPENALTGQLFMVNADREDPMYVPSQYAPLRFWRNTDIANLQQGQTATLPNGVLGYEWDEAPDNSVRPAGEFNLSSSTYAVSTYLLQYGADYGNGTATHHLSLYKANSGALVFGAGTVQWTFGLDGTHDYGGTPTDSRMQQATVNLIADMGAQPATLMTSLVPAAQSTDATRPTSTITYPTAGQNLQPGTVTITGTASDTGGGVVAGVEVSTDNGATWHPATGTTNWTYTWSQGVATTTIKSRAVDDSGNLETPSAGVPVTVGQASCPCTIWGASATPATTDSGDAGSYELGVRFRADVDGFVTGVRFYKATANTGTHTGRLWTNTGTLLASATFSNESSNGWQQVSFSSPVPVTANTTYVVSYSDPNGHFSLDRPSFGTAGVDNPPLHALRDGLDGANGIYATSPGFFPTSTSSSSNYWVDVVFNNQTGPDTTPPTVTAVAPPSSATGVPTGTTVTAQFSEGMDTSTITGSTFRLRDGSGTSVPATVAYVSTTHTATLTPTAPLASSTTYTATVSGGSTGVKDAAGNALAADYVWSFTTGAPGVCPCSIWSSAATPATIDSADAGAYELGVRFRSDNAGYVTGIRFYKATANTGTHVGRLWTNTGTLLASATFTSESGSGWQQVNFANPVAISANTTYVASYSDPNGHFSLDRPAFATSGVDNPPLHALRDGLDGANGVFASGTGLFPTSTSSSSNYWVDVVFNQTDTTPPTVTSVTPAAGATSVVISTAVTAQFSKPLAASSVTTSTFQLKDPSNNVVAATVTASGSTATLQPTSPLAASTTYTATLKGGSGGITDTVGNPLAADYVWTFTTATPATCPCSVWGSSAIPATVDSGDAGAYELGVRFRSDQAGWVTGIRFYKATANTGTHVGRLWSNTGTLLASATFTSESGSGWQQVSFSNPVAISANTTYVASYSDPAGHYSLDRPAFATAGVDSAPLHALKDGQDGANGVYANGPGFFPNNSSNASNYWVDVVFDTHDTTPPTVSSVTPTPGATGVPQGTTVTAQFSEAMNAATISGTTVRLTDPTNTVVPATVAYDAASQRATLTPNAPLSSGTAYSATVKGGTGGVTDLAGNALASDYSWSFTVSGNITCPCSIWSSAATPATIDSGDAGSYELGVRFRADVDGYVTGVRFYKATANTGTHVGRIWTNTGALLGSATFTSETVSGWQQATFTNPVWVTANTTYVASYSDPAGHYSIDRPGFATSGVDDPPLHALKDGLDGANGIYSTAPGVFPASTSGSSNYWVDVVYYRGTSDVTAPVSTTSFPAAGGTYGSSSWASGCASAGFCGTATDDASGVKKVELSIRQGTGNYWNGTSFASTTEVFNTATLNGSSWTYPFAAASFPAQGPYTVSVRATDNSGNVETANSRTFTYDTTPPSSTTTFPVASGNYNAAGWAAGCATAGVCGTASDGGGSGVQAVAVSIRQGSGNYWNGTGFSSSSEVFNSATLSGSNWSYAFAASSFPTNTTYTIRVRSTDVAGNAAIASALTFRYDTTLPSSSYTFPASGGSYNTAGWNAGCATVGFCGSDSDSGSGVQKVEVSLRQGSGNYWNGTSFASATEVFLAATLTGSTWSFPFGTASFPADGSYTARLRATDRAGNVQSPVSRTFTYDTTPPAVTTVTPANGATGVSLSANATITFNEPMAGSSFNTTTFVLRDPNGNVVTANISYNNGQRRATLSPPQTLQGLTTYTATVLGGPGGVTDAAGNPLPANYTWSFTTRAF